jgi:transposase
VDGEIVVERRRRWTPEEKAALMAEVEAEGGHASVVAQRHGISKSPLYNWRSAWKAAGLAARAEPSRRRKFVQLGVVADAGQGPTIPMTTGAVCRPAPVWPWRSADGVRVRVDSGVNEKALRRVLSAVRGLG